MALPTPSPTLFVSNLEGKTKKPELREQLYALFTPYGRVIDVVAKKNGGGRGQAFVVFAEQSAATAAMRTLTGELFYDKSLRISYAKTPSSATLARSDPSASRDAAAIKAAKLVVSRAQGEYEQLEKEREEEDNLKAGGGKRELDGGGEDGPATKRVRAGANGVEEEEEEEMEIEMEDDEDASSAANGGGPSLFCTNLPPECTEDVMAALFSQYTGFSTAKSLSPSSIPSSHPSPNPDAKAFTVSFDSRDQAEKALAATKGFLMQPGWEMGVSLA